MKRDLQLIQSTEQASSDKEKFERIKLQRRSMMVSEECRVYTKLDARWVKDSTKKHVRRNLETEIGESLQFVHDAKGKVLVYPDNLSRDELVKQNVFLMDTVQDLESKGDIEGLLKKSGHLLHNSIKKHSVSISWPPLASELSNSSAFIPGNLKGFLQHLIAEPQDEASLSPRIQRLIESVGQDIVYGVTGGQLKPPKHLMLPYVIKTLTGSVELIRMINRLGHGVSYTEVEELETAICIQKLESHTDESVPMPEQIQPLIPTTLARDNIDRLEETLSGGVYGPHPPRKALNKPVVKKRTLDADPIILPPYNAGERVGPPSRLHIALDNRKVVEQAQKKNLIWILASLNAASSQENPVAGWTGFNITTRDNEDVSQNTVAYLPTINAPATEMSTIHEVLIHSQKIMNTLELKSIVVVCDQAIHAKAVEILWKHKDKFSHIVPRLGAFHTIRTLMVIIGKRV
ncbi:hypothetical protein Pcinc_010719 [Petrolisthes cinctipes]|uniref:Uncharacterized protein n=1 Tax=Petrolisthes cinctipes TaxID=88211 RepID=A0AAE1G4D4_PETCI|nr:hypothetical protein Pcinc_010719 [Petrolisthes cinctipes]